MNPDFWRGKRVLITGHTGFKGGWLSLCLQSMGAEVHGYALAPTTEPNFHSAASVDQTIASSTIADITKHETLLATFRKVSPEIVFHLAAQALVRYSYQNPVETYHTNIMGTVHLLEAVRSTPGVKAVVNITTDKCYENNEWHWGYRESEPMGGRDPYSSSKGCVELVTAAYRDSFLSPCGVAVATARAGNVIGGGDWALDRLLPDFLRAFDSGSALIIRAPQSIRPWQHVLEPLSGYLALAERLATQGSAYAEPWNFGSADEDAQTVAWILQQLALRMPEIKWHCDDTLQSHEATYLKLDSSKARARLAWRSRWNLQTALSKTLDWHLAWRDRQDMHVMTLAQIDQYLSAGNAEINHGAF